MNKISQLRYLRGKLLIKKLTFFYFHCIAATKLFTMLLFSKSIVHLYANIVLQFEISPINIFLIMSLFRLKSIAIDPVATILQFEITTV